MQLWVIGDQMLKETKASLQCLKTAFIQDPSKPRLFIHDTFDVIAHYEDKASQGNFIQSIRNSFAQLLKANYKLPNTLLILLSNEILDDAPFAVTRFPKLLQWLLAEIDSMI